MIAGALPRSVAEAVDRWATSARAAAPLLALPFDRRPSAGRSPATDEARARDPEALRHSLALAVAAGYVPREALLAALVAVLHRYSAETTILVAERPAGPAAVALLDVEIADDATFGALVAAVGSATERARAGRIVPLEYAGELCAALPRDVCIAHAGFRSEPAQEDAWPGGPAAGASPPLALNVCDVATGDVRLTYAADLFDAQAAHRMLEHIAALLGAAVAAPGVAVRSLPLLLDAERALHERWNATGHPFDHATDLVELVGTATATRPDAVAAEFQGDVLTFGELDRRAGLLAERLAAAGVAPGTLVALAVERSVDMLVGVFGIQRAGGAYLPIDPEYPRDRIEYMLADSRAPVVVTQERLRDRFAAPGATVVAVDAAETVAPARERALPVDPERTAYVIYTSGSTGRPKGVVVKHRSVVNLLAGMRRAFDIGPDDTLLAIAPLAFDMSVPDVFLSTVSGARVVIASREVAVSPKALAALLRSSGATIVQATPSTWRMLVDAGWEGNSQLTIVTGGEALPPALADQLLERAKAVWNFYGPTEATVWATMHRLRERGETPSIGRPMANVTTHVLDADGRPVPVGVAGELYIGGAGLAAGYLHRPQLTAERFSQHRLGDSGPVRLYRTGDRARFRADGSLEFIGRVDFQVKLRGCRIELGEVESVLAAEPAVRTAVAVVRDDVPNEPKLIAYVIVRPGAMVTPNALRRAAGLKLPAYMVPDAVVFLERLPLGDNGKIDVKRLPAPRTGDVVARDDAAPLIAPRTPLETQLVSIWEDALDVRPIGVTDDFFDLGASSVSAARLFDRIERELGATLPLSPIFAAPTVERLAALLETGAAPGRFSSLVPIQPQGTKTPIFCVHGGAGTILHFAYLAKQLGEDQPFYGLQMRGLFGDAPPLLSVRAMATHYVRELREVRPRGPYVVAGYCFGSSVAFEMAAQLERAGEPVAKLILLNGPSPAYLWKHRRRRGLRWTVRHAPLMLATRAYAYLRRPLPDAWRKDANYLINYVAESWYRPKKVASSALVVSGAGRFTDPSLGWRPYLTGDVRTYEVSGLHRDARELMHEPHVAGVSAAIRSALEEAGRAC